MFRSKAPQTQIRIKVHITISGVYLPLHCSARYRRNSLQPHCNARLLFYLGLINLFSLRDDRNSGEQGEMFFIYVRLSFQRQRQRRYTFLGCHESYCNGTGWNITVNVDASTENAADCGIFTEPTSVLKFLTLWKISQALRDRRALSRDPRYEN